MAFFTALPLFLAAVWCIMLASEGFLPRQWRAGAYIIAANLALNGCLVLYHFAKFH